MARILLFKTIEFLRRENPSVLSEYKNVLGKAEPTIMENEKIIDRWKEQIR